MDVLGRDFPPPHPLLRAYVCACISCILAASCVDTCDFHVGFRSRVCCGGAEGAGVMGSSRAGTFSVTLASQRVVKINWLTK